MANLHLVTGYAGEEHITSNDQGSFNAALMGNGEFVLERGNQFTAQVISNNKVRIFDGDLLMQGRHIRLKENTYVDLFFENGTQNYKRSDLIVVRYEKDPVTDIESASLVVVKGIPTENAYVSSEKITGDIINEHALQNDTVLYRVNFDGLTIQEPVKVFSTVPTLETIKTNTIEEIKQEAEKAIQDVAYAAGEIVPLFGTESPTPETQGKVKQFFVNTENGELFICTEAGKNYTWIKIGGGLGGVPLSNCKTLALEEGRDKITLTWEDPDNVVFNGETLAEWAGTKVVRKEGGSPVSVDDGTLVVDSTVKDQYAVDGLQDSEVVADTQYNYALFPYTVENVYTMSDANRKSGVIKPIPDFDPVFANNTWEIIDEISRAGYAAEAWNLGDIKDNFMIIGFNHDDLANGTGKAGITLIDAQFLSITATIKSAWSSVNGSSKIMYRDSTLKAFCDTYYKNNSSKIEAFRYAKNIIKKCAYDKTSEEIDNVECVLFVPSYKELKGIDNQVFWNIEGEQYEGVDFISQQIANDSQNYYWTRSWDASQNYYDYSLGYRIYNNGTGSARKIRTDELVTRLCFCV